MVIGCVLAAALILFLLTRPGESVSGRVVVSVDGKIFAEGRIGNPEEIAVHSENGGENVVKITETGVSMLCSNCKNQLCVRQGEITPENFRRRALANRIICLPNRVLVEMIVGASDREDVPDA